MTSLHLHASVETLPADLALLAEAAQRSPQVRQRLFDLLDSGAQLVRVHTEDLPASAAGDLRIRFELSDGVRALLPAVRAG